MDRYKFCPACAGGLTRATKICLRCGACGFEVYDNPRLTLNVIIENECGEILFVRRNHGAPHAGAWDTPGGFVEPGETAEDGARREVFEETGLRVAELRYFRSYADEYEYQGATTPILAIAYCGHLENHPAVSGWKAGASMTIAAGDDAAEVKFLRPTDELVRQVPFSSDRQALIDHLNLKSKEGSR